MDKNINYLKNHYENYNYPEPVQDIEKELIEKILFTMMTLRTIGI